MKLWFVVPAHGRIELARICLRQLRRTCDALVEHGIEASAVVIACDENLDTAAELGFGTVRRDNRFLARKYNDGLQLALDPSVNPRPADYAVPMGSDDWLDYRILLRPPPRDAVLAFRRVAFVDESGSELTETELRYEGGVGIRVYPRRLLEPPATGRRTRIASGPAIRASSTTRSGTTAAATSETSASSTATSTPARSWTGRATACS